MGFYNKNVIMIFLFLLTCVSDQFFAPGSSGPRMIILQLLTFQCIFFTSKSCKCVFHVSDGFLIISNTWFLIQSKHEIPLGFTGPR